MTRNILARMSQAAAVSLGLLLPVLAPTGAAASAPVCYASWSDASPVVAEQRLMAVGELTTLAKSRLDGEIVRTTLCFENGRYIYKVVLRSGNGSVRPLTLDARQPFGR